MGSFCVNKFWRRGGAYVPFGDTLTTEQVRSASVWTLGQSHNPKIVIEPHEYTGGPELFLDVKPLGRDVPEAQRRKRVAAWCELLPTLTDVRRLWLFSHVPKRLFEAACELANLEALYVKWGNADDLSPLSALQNLRHVHLGSLTKVTDITPLAAMQQLRSLEIENFKRVEIFDDLAGLSGLELLHLDGSIWTEQKIASLDPIGHMSGLRSFSMINARLRSKSFDPLLNLHQLEGFHASWWFHDAEFQKLRALPKLRYGNVFERRPH